jgi:acyl carrier protein
MLETQAQIAETVNKLFVSLFELEPEQLLADTNLYQDLGLDSLDAIDLIIAFEKQFKINPPVEEVKLIRTMQDVYNMVLKYYLADSREIQ